MKDKHVKRKAVSMLYLFYMTYMREAFFGGKYDKMMVHLSVNYERDVSRLKCGKMEGCSPDSR